MHELGGPSRCDCEHVALTPQRLLHWPPTAIRRPSKARVGRRGCLPSEAIGRDNVVVWMGGRAADGLFAAQGGVHQSPSVTARPREGVEGGMPGGQQRGVRARAASRGGAKKKSAHTSRAGTEAVGQRAAAAGATRQTQRG